jgi:hypothetical protein
VVADGLHCERALLDGDVALDVVGRDAVERRLAEEGCDVVPQVGRDREPMRLLAALEVKAPGQLRAGLLHRHPCGAGAAAAALVALAQSAQLALGLCLGENERMRVGRHDHPARYQRRSVSCE